MFKSRRNGKRKDSTETKTPSSSLGPSEEEDSKYQEELTDRATSDSRPVLSTHEDPLIQSEGFQRMAEIYRLLAEVQEYGADIHVPIFVLVGHQSAGKSTVVNLLLKFPASFSQDATATRCPTMYFIEQSPNRDDPIVVEFEGQRLGSWHELHGKVRTHMDMLKQRKTFSSDPITIKVQSPNVSNFVVIDLPGMIRKPKGDLERDAIDAMVKDALLKPLPQQQGVSLDPASSVGKYNAIPVVVRKFAGAEVDDTFTRIDELIGRERPGWKTEKTTMVLLNRFDEKCNFGSAEEFYEQIQQINDVECGDLTMGAVFSCLRPPTHQINAGNLRDNHDLHYQYLLEVPQHEEEWMRAKFDEYAQLTPNRTLIRSLQTIREEQCGFRHLERQFALCMQRIVQDSTSHVRAALAQTERQLTFRIGKLTKAISNNRPEKFRQIRETVLGNFLQTIKVLLKDSPRDLGDYCSWDFQSEFDAIRYHLEETQDQQFLEFFEEFKLEIQDLRKLYSEEKHTNELRELESNLAGHAKFDRIVTAWKAMVSCMEPPKLRWEQKRNMKSGHLSDLQASFTGQLKNILKDMLRRHNFASTCLAEMLRCHYYHMADRVAAFLAEREYGGLVDENGGIEDDGLIQIQFLEAIREDYKRVVDRVIDRFLIAFAKESQFVFVDLSLPKFIMTLVSKLENAYQAHRMEVHKFIRAAAKEEAQRQDDQDPPLDPNFHSLQTGLDEEAPEPTSEDEKEEVTTFVDSENDNQVEEENGIGGVVSDVIGDVAGGLVGGAAGGILGAVIPGVSTVFSNAVTSVLSSSFQRVHVGWRSLCKKIRLRGEVRMVDLFNACMKKELIFDVADNESQASACAALQLQIYQLILIHNVLRRVHRIVHVINEDDLEGYVGESMRNGPSKNDFVRAVDLLSYSHDFGEDGERLLEEFLAKYQIADSKRMMMMTDDEVLKRYCKRDHKKLVDRKEGLKKEKAEFIRYKNEILQKLDEAGLDEDQHRNFSGNRKFSHESAVEESRNGVLDFDDM